jgi:hypothetical protein
MGKRFWLLLALACVLSILVSFYGFKYVDKARGTPVEYGGVVVGAVRNCGLFGCVNTIVITRNENWTGFRNVDDLDYAMIEKGDYVIITATRGKFTGDLYNITMWSTEE